MDSLPSSMMYTFHYTVALLRVLHYVSNSRKIMVTFDLWSLISAVAANTTPAGIVVSSRLAS